MPPFKGKSSTHRRNQRRKDNKRRAYLIQTGVLPPNATLADFRTIDSENTRAATLKPESVVQEPALETTYTTAAFEAKRKALLASINTGGIAANRDISREYEIPLSVEQAVEDSALEKLSNELPTIDAPSEIEDSQQLPTNDVPLANEATPRNSASISVTATEEPAVPAESSDSPISAKRRAKLDLASSRRLVFGSLGLRTPKTKEDEAKTREKLMRDVRPAKEIQGSGTIRLSEDFVPDTVREDESWKNNIILEAVECCHEGVVLSTPPFPFVQRWDPQQQLGYGGRGGRGKTNSKKRKRKSKQYDEIWKEQDAHYDVPEQQTPSYHEDGQESTEGAVRPKLDEKSRNALNDEVDEEAVNEQLMRESKGVSASIPIETEDVKDLPDLPEDMSLCSDLEQGHCVPGSIIAFKQLDMSAETNWQPRVSEYKTALISQLMDDGTMRMTLAKRDQPAREELYDIETGERIYGKFEMPGYEDAERDNSNGIVELSFADLINPKLVQALGIEQDAGQSRHLEDRESSTKYRTDIVMAQDDAELYPIFDESAPSKHGGSPHRFKAIKVNEEVRKEIRDLITDAGWRSSIASGVVEHRPQLASKPSETENDNIGAYGNDDDVIKISSPRFNGFSSSPPPNRPVHSVVEAQAELIGIETDESVLPQTVAETVATSSPRSEPLTSDKVGEDVSLEDRHSIDQDVIWDDVRSKPVSAESDCQSSSKNHGSPRPTLKAMFRSSGLRGGVSQRKTSPEPNLSFDGADSGNEFPTLEDVLASTRSSFESLVPEDEDEALIAKSSFETKSSADEDQKQRRPKSGPKRNARKQSKPIPEFRTFKDEDEGESIPRLSQIPLGSQIVDLTISSDLIYSPGNDEDDESYDMPSGSGWVRKTRASSKQLSPLRERGLLRSRTRSSV